MSEVALTLKSVDEIVSSKLEFYIPDYQRGYRWEEDQVEALLTDLEEFSAEKGENEFYCLQPLVVVKKDHEWAVVDGQQRLTTLFLILRQLSVDQSVPFQIRYERHPNSADGLAGLLEKLLANHLNSEQRSPDFHYLFKANEVVKQWLVKHPNHHLSLLGRGDGPFVKFIWYQLGKEDAIKAFSRLNAGKIRLTDAELIRALFLRSSGLSDALRLNIAVRWDQIERRFQEPEFWSFLAKRDDVPVNRIEFLFRQFAKGRMWQEHTERAIYDHFSAAFHDDKDGTVRKEYWEKLEELFSVFEEWFEDNELFHLIGFLIEHGVPLSALVEQATDTESDKEHFRTYLKEEVRKKALPKVTDLSEAGIKTDLKTLKYTDSRIKAVLLCLNLATLINDRTGTVRFSFYAYKQDDWDIEHIRATASRAPDGKKELINALTVIGTYAGKRPELQDLTQKLDKLTDNTSDEKLVSLYAESIDQLENIREMEPTNDISNLTLLDAETNRGYGCSPFQVKREWVLGLDHQAKYLLPSTRNVFTKSYSLSPAGLLSWTQSDATDYLDAMSKTLSMFFTKEIEAVR